ncbi:MAG: hypothetical protein AAF458_07170 [Pseudomonadota bacterium]
MVTLGVVGITGLPVALAWRGIRTLRIDNALQGVMLETAKTRSLRFVSLLQRAALGIAGYSPWLVNYGPNRVSLAHRESAHVVVAPATRPGNTR